jgi:integral membrane sensor signal transduction histidine kinase
MEEEKQLNTKQNKKINWRIKALLSILVSMIAIVVILFGITYVYFEKKLEDNTKKVAEATFRQADKELKKMLSTVEGEVNRYGSLNLPLEYLRDDYKNDVDKSVVSMQIIKDLDNMMLVDSNIYGISIIKADGRFILSASDRRSRSGKTEITGGIKEMLKKSEEKYPYMLWMSNYELEKNDENALHLITDKPSFIGVKYLGKGNEGEEDAFIVVSVDERSVRKTYESVVYNGSVALLVNDGGIIISETGKELLGGRFERKAGFQTIEHELKSFDWKLYNLVPKEGYLRETKTIRRFGLVVGFVSCILILIAGLIWSRRYTKPIQYLMDQMKLVQEENFDITQPKHQGWEELDTLNSEFYLLVIKLKKYISDIKAVERENTKKELLALQYQMNPHFLLGSINSIRWMAALTNNSVTANALEILAKILTPILRNPDFLWKLDDELVFCENYVSMMNIRYGNTMEYKVICDDNLLKEDFPRMILQPMIENCFIYGSDPLEKRVITVNIRKEDVMKVSVSNSGVNMDKVKLEGLNDILRNGTGNSEHIGLSNAKKRLDILYKDTGDIWLEQDNEGTLTVEIRF